MSPLGVVAGVPAHRRDHITQYGRFGPFCARERRTALSRSALRQGDDRQPGLAHNLLELLEGRRTTDVDLDAKSALGHGERRLMRAGLQEDPEHVANVYLRLIERLGWQTGPVRCRSSSTPAGPCPEASSRRTTGLTSLTRNSGGLLLVTAGIIEPLLVASALTRSRGTRPGVAGASAHRYVPFLAQGTR